MSGADLELMSPSLFDGITFEPKKDGDRRKHQLQDVYAAMQDGCWRSLYRIRAMTGHPEQSISARLRDLRKTKFGKYEVKRRRMTDGTHEYRLVIPPHQ